MLDGEWLFAGLDPPDPLSTRQLNRAIHAAADAANIDKRVSMHPEDMKAYAAHYRAQLLNVINTATPATKQFEP